jgi:predicted alpha/beta hydrolase
MWTFVLPVIVARKGYMAWSMLGMGDDLPLGVYNDWKRWCKFPHYYFDDPEMSHLHALYAEVTTPCVFATSVDDPWAPPRSRDAFVKAMVNAPLTLLDLQPPLGSKPYGHMGYFRESAQPLWDEVLDWLQSVPAHTT